MDYATYTSNRKQHKSGRLFVWDHGCIANRCDRVRPSPSEFQRLPQLRATASRRVTRRCGRRHRGGLRTAALRRAISVCAEVHTPLRTLFVHAIWAHLLNTLFEHTSGWRRALQLRPQSEFTASYDAALVQRCRIAIRQPGTPRLLLRHVRFNAILRVARFALRNSLWKSLC